MRPPRVVARTLLPLAATLLLARPLVAPARAEGERPTIYRWVDADGVAHYTAHRDRVPSAVRDSIQEIQPTATPEPAAAAAPIAPPAPGAPPAAAAAAATPESSWATQNAGPPPAPASGGTRLASRASDAAAADTSGLDARIAELEAEIARDEEAIKDFLSAPPTEGGVALPETPEFREIARRLPKLQADLRNLREQRGRAGGTSGSDDSDAPLGSGSERDDF